MEISVFDETTAPFSAEVTLSAEEVDALVNAAFARLARVFRCPGDNVRARAEELLTEHELATFLHETAMARAGERALSDICPLFLGTPKTESLSDFHEHAPMKFRITAHPVPAMNLDMETPIPERRRKKAANSRRKDAVINPCQNDTTAAPHQNGADSTPHHNDLQEKGADKHDDLEKHPEGKRPGKLAAAADNSWSKREYVCETLRARLNGTIPDALLRDALARKKEEFLSELGEKGITYREYRIAHGVKPQDVQDALYDEAFDELSRDIALDTVFATQQLAITADDEQRILTEMAPGRESALRDELEATGKLWMLAQKTRRDVALRWAVEHLLER